MLSPLVARTAGRQVAARAYSRSAIARAATEPKLHNATGLWEGLKAKRPVDADDLHLVFHTPFNPATVIALVTFVVGAGVGSMVYGVCHQQYKQGYWK